MPPAPWPGAFFVSSPGHSPSPRRRPFERWPPTHLASAAKSRRDGRRSSEPLLRLLAVLLVVQILSRPKDVKDLGDPKDPRDGAPHKGGRRATVHRRLTHLASAADLLGVGASPNGVSGEGEVRRVVVGWRSRRGVGAFWYHGGTRWASHRTLCALRRQVVPLKLGTFHTWATCLGEVRRSARLLFTSSR